MSFTAYPILEDCNGRHIVRGVVICDEPLGTPIPLGLRTFDADRSPVAGAESFIAWASADLTEVHDDATELEKLVERWRREGR